MKTSIVVPTRNRPIELVRFLESVLVQVEMPHEVIIVDSSDNRVDVGESFKLVKEKLLAEHIKFIFKLSSRGAAYQRNIGAALASGDILYFFDDDVVLSSQYLREMNKIFLNNPKYAGGMGTITDPKTDFSFNRFIRIIFFMQRENALGKFTCSGMPTHAYGKRYFCEVEVLGGCCMAYRKKIFDQYGFDENLGFYSYMEDCDLSKRISKKYPLFYNHAAYLQHLHTPTAREHIVINRARFLRNYSYLFFKNFYKENPFRIIAYLWTVIGLFFEAFLMRSKPHLKGYISGLYHFYILRKNI